MVTTSIQNFIVTLLQNYFPELEATEGSDLFSEIVQPILDRLGDDLFETDIDSFVAQRIRDEFPELDIDTAGSVARDVFVNPAILLFQAVKRELEVIRQAQSLNQSSTLSTEELDALLANVFVVRRPGSRAAGDARVYYAAPTTIQADPTVSFTASNGQLYVVDGTFDTTVALMSSQVEGDLYYVDIPVLAVIESDDANISAGQLLSASGLPGYVKVTNAESFAGGVTQETNSALLLRAGDLITERSLVTQRGVRTSLLQEYPELKGVSVIGTGDDAMTRDIIRGNTEVSGLGYGGVYAAGAYGYFGLSTTWNIWTTQRFPINNVMYNMATTLTPPPALVPNQVYADWYSNAVAVGDQVTTLGHWYNISAVNSPFPGAEVELEGSIVTSSDDYGLGGTALTAVGQPYMPQALDGANRFTCAPMFFTDTFGLTVPVPEVIKNSIDPDTDWLLVLDNNFSVGLGGSGTADKYQRTKYFPILAAEEDGGGNTTFTIQSQNVNYTPRVVDWIAWGAPDVAGTANWETFKTGDVTAINRGIGIDFVGAAATDKILLMPNVDVDFAGENVLPGDIITILAVEATSPFEVDLWCEFIIESINGSGQLVCVQDRNWLYNGAGAMFPTLFDAGGPYNPAGEVTLALYTCYWTVRRGNGSGTTTPDSTFCWPTSFMPSWQLPGAGLTYVYHAGWAAATPAGAVDFHRQFGESHPEAHDTVIPVAVANQAAAYEPWTTTEWAILRIPTAKLPALDADWSPNSNTPPYGYEAIESGVALGTDATYPIRFYGSWYTWGLADCGDPVHEDPPGTLIYRTDNWATQLVTDSSWAIAPFMSQWALRKPATSDDVELGIVLSQLPEIAEEVEIPPDEIHIGGMMDVYCNPSSLPTTTLATSPWVSFEDDDVVVPASFTGASATGGQAEAFGAVTEDDGIFTGADLNSYTWEFGDLLVITGPATHDYYNTSYAIVDQQRYTKNQIRVYPPFPDAAVHAGLSYVVLRGVTTDLTPIKLYKIRNGTDLKTNIGSEYVTSVASNFVSAGVSAGDTLYITEGGDLGYHTIAADATTSQIELTAALNGGETNVSFEVFTSSGFASLPIAAVERIEGMDINGAAVAVSLPYGGPLGATVRAAAMAGNSLVFPAEGVESATAYTLLARPYRVYSTTVDFDVIGVREGHRFLFTSGDHSGEAYTVTNVVAGATSSVDLVNGFDVGAAETGLTFEIGAPTQGTARCYFKSAVRATFDKDTRIGVGVGQAYMPDPDTHATMFTENTSDTDIQLTTLAPPTLDDEGWFLAAASTTFHSLTPFFTDAQHANKYLHIFAPAANAGVHLINAVVSTTEITLAAGIGGGDSNVLEWGISDDGNPMSVLTSELATNDWSVRGIKENSALAMGTRADSDLVYIDHQDIVGTVLAATLTAMAGKTLILVINGATATYTFSVASFPYTSLPQYIEAGFPQVEAKVLEDPAVPGNFLLHLYSTEDVVVGAGTANADLGLTTGDTTVVPAGLRGPFEIRWNGIGIESEAPPISATNLSYISIVQRGTDTPVAGTLTGKLLHVRILRPGTQVFEQTAMTTYGNYYYVDLDISSYYPGPTQILVEATAATAFTGVVTNGFTYVADEDHAYSILEDMKLHTNGTYSAIEYPTPVLGTSAQIVYTHAPDVEAVHYFMQNKTERTVTCNTLAKVSIPLEVSVQFTFKSSTSLEGARKVVVDYFRSLPHGTLFTVRAFTSAMKTSGILIQGTPTIFVIAPNNLRVHQLYSVTEEYQMPENGAFLEVGTILTKG